MQNIREYRTYLLVKIHHRVIRNIRESTTCILSKTHCRIRAFLFHEIICYITYGLTNLAFDHRLFLLVDGAFPYRCYRWLRLR